MANLEGYFKKSENNNYRFRDSTKGMVLFFAVLLFVNFSIAQKSDSLKVIDNFSGTASITNNGISLVPSFSLGDPALLFDLKFRKGKFSFEPDMRFALEGKPWAFLFWFRYKAIQKERFSLRIGAHPAMNFRTVNVIKDGISQELIQSRRYLAAEIVPTYQISDKVSIGMYYLYGQGFDEGVKQTNFLVMNSSFNKLFISEQYYLNVSPQVYFLTSDDLKGFYSVAYITFAKKDFPLSISTTLNKAIDTEIVPEDDFIWNVSLVYNF